MRKQDSYFAKFLRTYFRQIFISFSHFSKFIHFREISQDILQNRNKIFDRWKPWLRCHEKILRPIFENFQSEVTIIKKMWVNGRFTLFSAHISTMKKISFKNTSLPYPSENLELLTQNYPKPPSNLVHRYVMYTKGIRVRYSRTSIKNKSSHMSWKSSVSKSWQTTRSE